MEKLWILLIFTNYTLVSVSFMLFKSIGFAIFLPIVFLLYGFVTHKSRFLQTTEKFDSNEAFEWIYTF